MTGPADEEGLEDVATLVANHPGAYAATILADPKVDLPPTDSYIALVEDLIELRADGVHDPDDLLQVAKSQLYSPVEGDLSGTTPGVGGEERPHDNPIDAQDVTDDDRAAMLHEYLAAFVDKFGRIPRLMPLDEEGKAPVIQGRCRLDSPEGRSYLVDGEEAIRQIREEGARGFAIYAGKRDHGTEDVVFVDHDEPDAFPAPTGDPTLEVLSGSGRGPHETYRNAGDVRNARVGDNSGEIRAENWYVVTPGSIHPSGGVYHITENREIATLADEELTDDMRPASGRRDRDTDGPTAEDLDGSGDAPEGDDLDARLEAAFNNSHDGERIKQVYNGRYRAAGFDDRSGAEFWLANRLDSWVGQGNRALVGRLMDRANLQKWPERTDRSYRDSVLSEVGHQDWYYDPDPDPDHVAVLPPAVRNVWDWRDAGEPDDRLTIDDAHDRCQTALEDAIGTYANQVLIEALPTLGKSSGTIRATAATGTQITMLTGRGREEQYEQIREWCIEEGIPPEDIKILPSFTRDCDCASGEHGDDWQEKVMSWYRRGATPQAIHKYAERELGRPLPCHAGDRTCPYTAKWNFDPDDRQVLIGHYVHAHNDKITQGRTVVFDEFPGGAYETSLDHATLPGAVSYFLECHEVLPFEDFTDLIENRDDDGRRADALLWFEDNEPKRDSLQAITNTVGHAIAPLVTFTLLAGDDLTNGWERADLEDGTGLYDRSNGGVHLMQPPDLQYASGIVGLDGTPTAEMWEKTLGTQLTTRQVLTDDERQEYLRDVLELQLVRTTDAVKSYSPEEKEIDRRVSLKEDAALLEAIGEDHGQKPALITTNRAEDLYRNEGLLDLVDDHQHYGNILGSNRFAQNRLGAVIGSRNFGPDYVKKWGAYLGEAIEPTFPSPENDFTPTDYGDVGNRIRMHMRDHETLQAAMRFGRDGNGATVYVHTNTLPDWVPIAGEGQVLKTWSDGMKQVIEAARDLDEWTTAELASHHAVDIGERQVRDHLHSLADRGVVDVEIEGCEFVWRDDGLHRVREHGEVELVDPDSLSDAESAELARTTSYRWECRTSSASSPSAGASLAGSDEAADRQTVNGGDRLSDDPG